MKLYANLIWDLTERQHKLHEGKYKDLLSRRDQRRNARFVVAELSHHNNGAYWEAGFAKGLSKPVIYMFNKEIAGHASPPHFDVGSDHIIFWDKKVPEQAAQELKDIIRNTLFGEAIQG